MSSLLHRSVGSSRSLLERSVLSALVVAVTAALGLFFSACNRDTPGQSAVPADTAAGQASIYHCPMHPTVTSTKPGSKCPECGMFLVAGPPPASSGPSSHEHGHH